MGKKKKKDIYGNIGGLVVMRDKRYARLKSHDAVVTMILNQRIKSPGCLNTGETTLDGIVFSRDRAMQLHALLSTYVERVHNRAPLHILYKATTARHLAAYEQVFDVFRDDIVAAIPETAFREQLVLLLQTLDSESVFFLTDDILFIRETDLRQCARFDTSTSIFSLRLGRNLTHSHIARSSQPLPNLQPVPACTNEAYYWRWADGEYEWQYPLSVDGHIFSRLEMLRIAENISFSAPNSFELQINRFQDIFLPRYGICFETSRIVNVPCNKVQTEVPNSCGNVHQDDLLQMWEAGMQIDFRLLYDMTITSAHQEVAFECVDRATSPV